MRRCYIHRQSKTVFVGNCHMVTYYSQGLSWLAFWSLRTSSMEMLPPQSWMSDWAKPLSAPPLCSLWSLHKPSYGRQGPPWRCRCLSPPSIGHPGQISFPEMLPRHFCFNSLTSIFKNHLGCQTRQTCQNYQMPRSSQTCPVRQTHWKCYIAAFSSWRISFFSCQI